MWMWWLQPLPSTADTQEVRIHFLDVGQGDSILIQSPNGNHVLIDGGPDTGVVRELGHYLPFVKPSLQLVLATHYDTDHVGGLLSVLERYTVQQFAAPLLRDDTTIAQNVAAVIQAMQIPTQQLRAGDVYKLGGGVRLEILSPTVIDSKLPRNTMSIVAQLIYGDTAILLTGDAPKAVEEYLVLRYGEYLESDVLKVGHHGSRTSTSQLFLETVDPELAIISAGKDNSYGHPHVEVTDSLFNAGVDTYSTASQGTIIVVSDGKQVWVE